MTADGGRVLVVASYPPVATRGAAVALNEVRRLLAAGRSVTVSSPRPSAAPYAVAVTGPLAGHRLRRLAELTGATELVLCAEPDLPVPVAAPLGAALPALQRASVDAFVRAAAGFRSFTLLVADDLGIPAELAARLEAAADVVDDRRGAAPVPGVTVRADVTVLGPGAHSPAVAARTAAGKLARRGLAPLPVPVRNTAYRAAHALADRLR